MPRSDDDSAEAAGGESLLDAARSCTLCAGRLPLGPRPVLQWHPGARLLIAAQAPGRKVHASGVPFDDASGDRLRQWLGLDRATFHDATRVAVLPMGFCYPGTGTSGDLPPRRECAPAWRSPLLAGLTGLRLTVVIGLHALAWHLPGRYRGITEAVADWRALGPGIVVLPHPSPLNNRWLFRNRWFESELLPTLPDRVRQAIG